MTRAQASQVQFYRRRPRTLRAALWLLALGAAVGLALVAQAAHRARSLARVERMAEEWHRLPRPILTHVRLRYEKGHLGMAAKRAGGAAACGPWQLFIYDLARKDGALRCQDAQGPGGAWSSAARLAQSRDRWRRIVRAHGIEAARREMVCEWSDYNSGDAARLCAALNPGGET